MAGNVTQIRSGEQVAYRLGGDRALSADQIAYRLGLTTDARTVMWIGAGATARTLGVTSGEPVTGADVPKVRAIMEGVNPVTGEVLVAPKIEVAPAAKVAAVPAYDAIVLAAASQGKTPVQLFTSARGKADWGRLERAVKAKGDFHRVPAFRLATLGAVAGVDVSTAYPAPEWDAAMAAKDERVTVGVKAYDVRLTLPKGASLALVMDTSGHRAQRMDLWSQSARSAYEALADRVAYGVRGHHGNGATAQAVAGTGFVGTVTVEATSRAGDPHLHAHSMIANLTICEDGTARTIGAGGRDVMAHGDWTAELAQLAYRTESARLGLASWAWNPTIGKYDDASIGTAAK
ncbi:MAG: relaxase domain-containing protein, partial [Actinomycetes bacterium]